LLLHLTDCQGAMLSRRCHHSPQCRPCGPLDCAHILQMACD
jgi:hypothetical protein